MKTGPKADKPAASRVAKIEGKKLHYVTAGQGPALILLHGYTQTSRMWRPLIDKLKDKFTVIAPDLPGIGDSDVPKDGCDMKTAVTVYDGKKDLVTTAQFFALWRAVGRIPEPSRQRVDPFAWQRH